MLKWLKSEISKLFCAPTGTWTQDLPHRTSTFNTEPSASSRIASPTNISWRPGTKQLKHGQLARRMRRRTSGTKSFPFTIRHRWTAACLLARSGKDSAQDNGDPRDLSLLKPLQNNNGVTHQIGNLFWHFGNIWRREGRGDWCVRAEGNDSRRVTVCLPQWWLGVANVQTE